MTYLSLAQGADAVLVDGWRIPAADVGQVRDALALHAAARDRLAGAEAQAAEAAEAGRAAGYAAGREEGRRAAASETAEAFAALVAQVRGEGERLRRELGRLSLEVVRRVADDLGPQATLEAVAHRAAREVLAEAPLAVRVAPDAAPGVAQRLWPLNAEVEVVGDAAVAPGDCVITSRHGSAHAGLALQLAALERAFREAQA